MINAIKKSSYMIVAPNLDSSQQEILKMAAIISMLISHIGMLFISFDTVTFAIGRVAFPLFAFLMIYNYIHHTSSPVKYIIRIFIVAVISQAPYALTIGEGSGMINIMFTLSAGLFIVHVLDIMIASKTKLKQYTIAYAMITFFFAAGLVVDYIYLGLILIISYWGWLRFPSHITFFVAVFATLFLNFPSGVIIMYCGLLAIVLILIVLMLNVRVPRLNKWVYYFFYPVHLFAIHIAKILF